MRTLTVKVIDGKDYTDVGTIEMDDKGKVDLNFKDKDIKAFFTRVGLGTTAYVPADGEEYLDAVLAAFSMSSTIIIGEKGNGDKAGN